MPGKLTSKMRVAYGASLIALSAMVPAFAFAQTQAATKDDTGVKKADDSQVVVVTGSTFVVAELRAWYAPAAV